MAALLLLGGCAAQNAYRDARTLLAQDQAQEALRKLEEAVRLDPQSAAYRLEYLRTRERLTRELLAQAEAARLAHQYDQAEAAYRRALLLQPSNEPAVAGIKNVERDRRWELLLQQARAALERKEPDAARARLRSLLLESPANTEGLKLMAELDRAQAKTSPDAALAEAYRKTVSLEFRDTPLKTVFELIARSSALNFVFDKDVRMDQKTSIFLRNSTVEAALSRVLLTNQLEQRVLDGNTVLIYPDTPAKQKDYQLLTLKSFYLSHTDAKTIGSVLKSLLKAKDVTVYDRLNLVVLRDSPDVVRLAERLVALHDLPDPEVMLDVEVLEVKRSHLLDLGVRWPDQLALTPLASTSGANLTLADLRNLTTGNVGVTVGQGTITAGKTESDANILANPRIRAKNREKARILIGDRVPNITSTSTSTGFVSDSVNYIDVGLKLEVEPSVYPDGEVAIKLSLEVSSLVNKVETKSGSLAYQIGTRNVATMLRLKDGENQILAGLINDEDRRSAKKIPGLGDVPLAGRLFGGQADDTVKTEIVLSITPRIIRGIERPDAASLEFESGTESGARSRGADIAPPARGPTAPAAGSSVGSGAAAAQAMASAPSGGSETSTAPKAAASSASDALLRLRGPLQVRGGETFSVDLTIEPKRPVSNLPLAIGFDPLAVQVLGVVEGEFMQQGGVRATTDSRVDGGGQVLITVTRAAGTPGAAGPGRVITLNLRALQVNRTANFQVLTVAPLDDAGAAMNVGLPPPLSVAITP